MGKKGRWFSAIKRVFTHNSKDKTSNEYDKKSSNEKKKGKGILRHGESKSFIPLFREPSSIEQILGEADQLLIRPPITSSHEPKTTPSLLWTPSSPRISSPIAATNRASLPTVASPTVSSDRRTFTDGSLKTDTPKVTQSRKEIKYVWRPKPTLRNRYLSATKIQSAYRGYLARRNFRALKGLVRLQGMVRSKNAKRQTMNAMKQMQLLVRVQTQIQSRRIQMLENQTLNHQGYRDEKEAESVVSKWTTNRLPEAELNEDWDDSVLTKDELEARLRNKVEVVMKRERAMAYAYSHQLWKSTNPKSAQTPLENQPAAFPWWWNWLERQLPPTNTPQTQAAAKKVASTPPRSVSENKPSPQLNTTNYNNKHKNLTLNNQEPLKPKLFQTTPIRTPSPAKISGNNSIKHSKPRANINYSPYNNDFPLRDDDSLTSCPPFSVPNYMTPTMSAKAKARANSNPKERLQGTTIATPVNDSKRRFSFSFTPNIVGSFKWNKGSSKNDSVSQKAVFEKHRQYRDSIGDLSIDSAVSMPAVVGRKPFNRFV
ncbi:protein iq-domain 14 [Phtheirospermum japonicum]|uniref:Protein iq-domain 14 n=1 Tax=Phtheirospermum japonicum TaxID=374723 RepID=A0A830DBR4_9LAMI|nr:protein iq-domain 14 [Phtheirospermum japonicum]